MAQAKQTFSDLGQDRVNFAREEENILEYWRKIDAFKQQLKVTEGQKPWTFYDGPPFANGRPHYGHILAGTIKDVLCRYASQTGHHVERRFGWDTHGLPIEYEIEKEYKITSREEVLEMGIREYNARCRSIVMRCADIWETTVERMGRWIDFKNDYKTLDLSFMESVWWVFKTMHSKGLVYRGFKVMPYSTALNTPLSNFEAKSNYKTKKDPAVIVTFPLLDSKDHENTSFLAWTTTPWTLPSNLALCVNADLEYVKFEDTKSGKFYICGKDVYNVNGKDNVIFKGDKKNLLKSSKVVCEFKGKDLVGIKYEPLFNYFNDNKHSHCFRVVSDGYVSKTAGTAIVHQAPGFGEDDLRVCEEHGVYKPGEEAVVCPVDHCGKYTDEVKDYHGQYVLDANKPILKDLRSNGRVWVDYTMEHEYPYCWRSETPLIYRSIPSWYIKVTDIKEDLLKNNQKTYWVPDYVKDKRFHNWLADARDWAVSRNRYWGTPIPIWISDDEKDPEWIVVGSVAELAKLSGKKIEDITDLHRENVDDIVITSPTSGKKLRRVDEVFDCWFESGSMPYGQCHYPFAFGSDEFGNISDENKQKYLNTRFPADFIAEGLDQTRGWFYTLLVISTALFNEPAWKNLIVNGLVLAADGKKMSKSKGNFPDPSKIFDEYGADALRLYLCNSPVVHASELKFQEEGVQGVVKEVLSPWWNVYKFFVENASRFERSGNGKFRADMNSVELSSIMDKWIVSELQSLIKFVRQEMEGYRLYTVVPELLKFVENLCNWYVRMNRTRIRGQTDTPVKDANDSLSCLFHVLLNLSQLMAPLTPFVVETMYLNLRKALPESPESVHFLNVPEPNEKLINLEIERRMRSFQNVIQLGRNVRNNTPGITSLKQPVREVLIFHPNIEVRKDCVAMENEIANELNAKSVVVLESIPDFMKLRCKGNVGAIGKEFGAKRLAVSAALEQLTMEQCFTFMDEGSITLVADNEDVNVKLAHVDIAWKFAGDADDDEKDDKKGGKGGKGGKGKNKGGKGKNKGKDNKNNDGAKAAKEVKRDPMADVYSFAADGKYLLLTHKVITHELKLEGIAREVCNRIQKLRKAGGLVASDVVTVYYDVSNESDKKQSDLGETLSTFGDFISERTRVTVYPLTYKSEYVPSIVEDNTDVEGEMLHLSLCTPQPYITKESMVHKLNDDKMKDAIEQFLCTKDYNNLKERYPQGANLTVTIEGQKFDLVSGKDFAFELKTL